MNNRSLSNIIQELLRPSGITINGNQPYDLIVNNENLYSRTLQQGPLGLGEAYMDGWWDSPHLDEFFTRVLIAKVPSRIKRNKRVLFKLLLSKLFNMQSQKRSFIVGRKHYDLGVPLFQAMLDSRMNYTCGYWKNATTLDEAQLAKLELTCQKLQLKPGMRMLDIGCGFGALAKHAAENYGVSVVGITISQQQCEYAKKNCASLPVEIRLQDYRDVNEKFDRIASLGMFEHVGHSNYRTYMQVASRCLSEDGLFLLHTIGDNITSALNEWMTTYIFPNSILPSISTIGKACEGLLVMEDWHNFGADYDKTLLAWYDNFVNHWETLKNQYDDRFHRMWKYYLLSCAGASRARTMQLWQIVFSKNGVPGVYQAPR